jgi:predicted nuclease of predicted toxin-antitoxin system
MRFLADMCVDIRIVGWLRENGHDTIHLRDEGLHRMPNGEIFRKGIMEDRVILTFDLDFAEIAALSEGEKTSVVLFRLKNTRTANVIKHLRREGDVVN